MWHCVCCQDPQPSCFEISVLLAAFRWRCRTLRFSWTMPFWMLRCCHLVDTGLMLWTCKASQLNCMVGPGGHYPEWGNPITKELKWYVLTDKWILAQKLRIPKIQSTWNSRRMKTKVWTLCPFLELGTKYPWKELQRQSLEMRQKDGSSSDCHIQRSIP